MRQAVLEIPRPGFVTCECGRDVTVMPTYYGQRATCGCGIRWTWIRGEGQKWTAETTTTEGTK